MTKTIKEIFKLVEKSNELSELIGEKKVTAYVNLWECGDTHKFTTYAEYKKLVKAEVIESHVNDYLNPILTQDEKYKETFEQKINSELVSISLFK